MAKLIGEIVDNRTGEAEQALTQPAAMGTASRISQELARVALILARLWYVALPSLYALLLAGIKLLPSVPGLLSRQPRRRTKARYHLAMVRLAGIGQARRPTESPREHAERVGGEKAIALDALTELYLKASFDAAFTGADDADAAQAQARFAASFRQRIVWPLRLLGALNPFGARGP